MDSWLPAVEILEKGEFKLVPEAKLKALCRKLRRDPKAGKPLERQLKGCYSIRPDGVLNRVIYHIVDDGKLVEILATERRREGKVHDVAERRLQAVG